MTDSYLLDMSVCLPGSALSTEPKKGHWRLIDYELENLKGTMLWANSKTGAPDVVLPANLSGWHAVYLGIWDWAWSKVPVMITEGQVEGGNMLKVKLNSDDCFTTVSKEFSDFRVEEFFWKTADLSGEHFVIGQQSEGFSRRACLAYIRATPISSEEVRALPKSGEGEDTKRLVAMNDGWSWIYETHPKSRAEIHSQLVRYRDSDFGKVFYEYGYPAPQGYEVYDIDDFPRQGEEIANDSIRFFKENGIEPFREVVDYGHSIGLQVFASVRLGLPKTAPPFDTGPQDAGAFFLSHPGFVCVERDGTPFPCLSYAFPEVRSHVVKTFEKAVALGADGVNPLFHRGPPFVLYEAPLVGGFMDAYGEDPRKLPETEARWLKFRARALTEFMIELRRKIFETARELGQQDPQLSCVVFPTHERNLFYGMDVEEWVRGGLVDCMLARDVLYASWEQEQVDLRYFEKLTKGTKCRLYVMLGSAAAVYRTVGGGGSITEAYSRRASELYAAGVEGIAFWDTNLQDRFTATWSAMRRLGHADELKASSWRSPPVRSTTVRKLGGIDVSFRHDAWYYV